MNQTRNRLADLIRRFSRWSKDIGKAMDELGDVDPSVKLIMQHEGGYDVIVPVEREVPEGYLCNPERSGAWYAFWPFVNDFAMEQKRLIPRNDTRIKSVVRV